VRPDAGRLMNKFESACWNAVEAGGVALLRVHSEAGSNLVDMGRCAARGIPEFVTGMSTPKPDSSGGEEVTVKVCGVAVAMLPEYSWAPPDRSITR
jgi:hypothetical protein